MIVCRVLDWWVPWKRMFSLGFTSGFRGVCVDIFPGRTSSTSVLWDWNDKKELAFYRDATMDISWTDLSHVSFHILSDGGVCCSPSRLLSPIALRLQFDDSITGLSHHSKRLLYQSDQPRTVTLWQWCNMRFVIPFRLQFDMRERVELVPHLHVPEYALFRLE